MERSLERTDAAADGAMHIGFGGRDGAARKCARIEVVLCIKNERDIKDFCSERIWLAAGDHPEQVCRVIERGVGIKRCLAFERALADADEGGDLRE